MSASNQVTLQGGNAPVVPEPTTMRQRAADSVNRLMDVINRVAVKVLPTVAPSLPVITPTQAEELARLEEGLRDPSSPVFQAEITLTMREYDAGIKRNRDRLRELDGDYLEDPASLLHQTAGQPEKHAELLDERDRKHLAFETWIGQVKAHVGADNYFAEMGLQLEKLREQQAALSGEESIEKRKIGAQIALLKQIQKVPAAEKDSILETTVERMQSRVQKLQALRDAASKPQVDWQAVQHTGTSGVSFFSAVSQELNQRELEKAERAAHKTARVWAQRRDTACQCAVAGVVVIAAFTYAYVGITRAIQS